MHLNLIIYILSLFILSCSKNEPKQIRPQKIVLEKGLDRVDAQKRKKIISNVHYKLGFDLTNTENTFKGETKIAFDLKSVPEKLRVDFFQGDIKKLVVNHHQTSKFDYNDHFILLPNEHLIKGANEVHIEYLHQYSNNGSGLHRFLDPQDNEVYLYTDFEPYDANALFPSFDQPNLRATYEVQVTAPKSWQIITSVREKSIQENKANNLWYFEKSKNFATYIFSLHAGPYAKWEDSKFKIPLRLFARKSLSKYIDAKNWFTITKQGFEFYNKYFELEYPYQKYDQVIVPDFNSGAMENVAAVTFNERYVYRSIPTYNQREQRASVILHEMAHMWFGDLVTMEWWNGLWLNESFATFMATKALYFATEFTRSWDTFYTQTKQWAYWEDQLVTTHPIELPVVHTENAFSNFDGITYGKGASVLKQLDYLLGQENFRKGIAYYLKTHQEKNTNLSDFLNALEHTSKRSLTDWANQWLKQAGPNSIQVQFTCTGNKLSQLSLLQSAPVSHPQLREHATVLALFSKDTKGKINLTRKNNVTYNGKETKIDSLVGAPCPELIYPNYQDFDYAKVVLDNESLKTIRVDLSKIEDTNVRMMIWPSLWEMVVDGKLSLNEYIQIALHNLPLESDYKIISWALDSINGKRLNSTSVAGHLRIALASNPLAKKPLLEFEQMYFEKLTHSIPGSELQKLWFEGLVKLASTPFAIKKLSAFLNSEFSIDGLDINQEKRWDILAKLSSSNVRDIDSMIDRELENDQTDFGQNKAIVAQVVRPDEKLKREWFTRITDKNSSIPLAKLKWAMWNLFPAGQEKFKSTFANDYYNVLHELVKTKPGQYLSTFAGSLTPTYCDSKGSDQLKNFIASNSQINPVVLKKLKISYQEDLRCQLIQKNMSL